MAHETALQEYYEGLTPKGSWDDWDFRLRRAEKEFSQWEERCKRIVKRYRDEREENPSESTVRFNALWSNIQTLLPTLYARTPAPDVGRRHRDADPVGRAGAQILERATVYTLDAYDFDHLAEQCVLDYALTGRAVAWAEYEAGLEGEDAAEEVSYEMAKCAYVDWRDFRHEPARCWAEVGWVARRHYYTYEMVRDRFGADIAAENLYEAMPEDLDADQDFSRNFKRAQIWEIWDKRMGKVVWFCPQYKQALLDSHEPVIKFKGFFPCPRPLYGTLTNDTLIPVPDYAEYQDQARELDRLTARIALLTKSLRVAGVYDASVTSLQRLIEEQAENELIPVENWPRLAGQGGLKGAVDWLPMAEIAATLLQLYDARERVKRDLAEISGVSDIVRGQGDYGGRGEVTATEQRIKGRFATMRLNDRQREVQRFLRDLIRLKVEIMAEMFSPMTLWIMSGFEFLPQSDPQTFGAAVAMIRKDPLREFRIDIETDSTIAEDEAEEKEDRMELIRTLAPFLEKAIEAVERIPGIAPVINELLLFVVRGFRAGRSLETSLEQALPQIAQHLKGKKGDEGAAAEARLKAMELQMKGQEGQAKLQLEQAKLRMESEQFQMEFGLKEAELRQSGRIEQAKVGIERQKASVQGKSEEMKILTEQQRLVLENRAREREMDRGEQEFKASEPGQQLELVKSAQDMARAASRGMQASISEITDAFEMVAERMRQIQAAENAPKRVQVIRDSRGRITGAVVNKD